jgi:hypothetical protein
MSAHHEARAKVRSSDEEVPLTPTARAFAAAETAATRTPPACLPGAGKRALSAQGHFGSCVRPLQLPAELPFLQLKKEEMEKANFGM